MESDDTDNVISKKSRRKLDKKENKYKHFISQLPGIQHSSEPTKFLMICNAGLVNGFDEGQAVQIFSKYGLLVSVSMLPGKSFCFVTFSETAGAQNTYNNLNGKMKLPKMLGPIYMIYTTAAPSSKMECLGKRPNGIFLLEKFITEDEERKLVNSISFNETTHSGNPTLLKNRRVKHYGYEFQYSNNNVNREEKLPEDLPNECNILKQKLDNHGWGHLRWPADQLTVNEYQPGQGIPPHIDTHSAFESPIMSLSLLSDIVMEFRHADGSHFPLHLPRRSLLIMDEEARYDWTHAIRPRKMDVIYGSGPVVVERGVRISFTFRWLREGGCKCIYRDQCDSQATKASSTLDCDASRLESQHVHQVYNKISSHFSQTRYRAWPNVAEFVASLPSGSVLFDVGCGNGKYFGLHRNIFEVEQPSYMGHVLIESGVFTLPFHLHHEECLKMGGDRSDGLLEECSRRGFEGVQCDCLQLPLRSESVDGLICIAVIHHLSTHERRVDAIREMARVLRQGGRGLVYVWAKDQQRNNIPSKYLKQEGGLKNKAGEEDARNKGDCDRRGKKCSKTKLDHRERVNISRCDKRCEEKNVELVREDVERIRISENKCLEPKLGRDVENCYVNSERETWKTKLDHGKARNVGSCDAENRERKCLEPKLGRDVENCCVNSETETWKTKLDHGKASCIEKSEGVKGLALDQEDDENIGICNEVTSVRRGLERELNERKVAQVSAEENVENMSSCKNRGRETTKLDEVNRKNREMESTCNSDQDVVLTNVSGCNTESRDGISLNHESSLSNISGSYTEIKYSMSFNRESSQEIVKGFSCNDREKSVNQHKININSCENIENVSKTSENNELCSPESEFLLPVHNNRTQFKHDDILVPWTFKTETFYRYYHVFKEGELEDLCSFVSEIQVEKIYYDQGNWCVIFEKCGK